MSKYDDFQEKKFDEDRTVVYFSIPDKGYNDKIFMVPKELKNKFESWAKSNDKWSGANTNKEIVGMIVPFKVVRFDKFFKKIFVGGLIYQKIKK